MKKTSPSNPAIASTAPPVSASPDGERFPLPREEDYAKEFNRLKRIANEQRLKGREIVVVMGVGFVGAVMAGVVADSTDRETGSPLYFVMGMQRPSTRSFWKIPYLNRGIAPVEAEDPEVAPLIERCVLEKQTLIATYAYDALALADCFAILSDADIQTYFERGCEVKGLGRGHIQRIKDRVRYAIRE